MHLFQLKLQRGCLKTQLNAQYLISWSGIFSFWCFHRAFNQAVWMGRCEGFTARLNRLMCKTVYLRYVQQFICVVFSPTLSAHITEGLDVWYDLGCVLHQSRTTNIQQIMCKPPTAILFKPIEILLHSRDKICKISHCLRGSFVVDFLIATLCWMPYCWLLYWCCVCGWANHPLSCRSHCVETKQLIPPSCGWKQETSMYL